MINKERKEALKTIKKLFAQPPTPKNVLAQIEVSRLCDKWGFTEKELK